MSVDNERDPMLYALSAINTFQLSAWAMLF
jgi:hypothetical protein